MELDEDADVAVVGETEALSCGQVRDAEETRTPTNKI